MGAPLQTRFFQCTEKNIFARRARVHADVKKKMQVRRTPQWFFLLRSVHQNIKVHRMTAAARKQGACFPADIWEAIERKAADQKTTRSKIIVQAVRAMVERDSKRRTKK